MESMVNSLNGSAPSFQNSNCTYNHPQNLHQKSFLYFNHFHKIICKTRTNTSFLYTSAIFYLSIISYIATIYSKNSFSAATIQLIQDAPRSHGAREPYQDLHCFNLSLPPQNMNGEQSSQSLIPYCSGSLGVLQVVVQDDSACNRNGHHPIQLLSNPQPIVITAIPY